MALSILSIFLVIAFEIVNSAIENVVDLASDYHFSMRAKNAKDMAAGAVLVVSGFAVVTGLIIFVPKILGLDFLKTWKSGETADFSAVSMEIIEVK